MDAVAAASTDAARSLASQIRGDAQRSALLRVSVYANAYFTRIHDCLRDDFPALAASLGADAFHDLVKTYLMRHPPRHASLRYAGMHLAEHLSTPPYAAIFGRVCGWAADLAALEWAILDAFDARDAAPIDRRGLANLPSEAWDGLQLVAVPSLRRIECEWPVHGVRMRFDAGGPEAITIAPPIAREASQILVWRRDERVYHREVDRIEWAALDAWSAGASFGGICERLAVLVGARETPRVAAGLLARWLERGLIADYAWSS